MTALSDALTAAQRSALAALEKAYVAGAIEAEAMSEAMESCGITDAVDRAFLIASLDILKEWGVSAPNLTERLARENGTNFGLAMGASYEPTSFTDPETNEDHFSQLHVGYTTDQAKADKARDKGATVTSCGGPSPSWEITVRVIDP